MFIDSAVVCEETFGYASANNRLNIKRAISSGTGFQVSFYNNVAYEGFSAIYV